MGKNKFNFYAFKLGGIMILIFIVQVLIKGFSDLFVLNSRAISGEVWRFFTSIFLHGGTGHLVYNLFALILFGSILEKLISGRKFLIVFFITGILANLVSVNFYNSSLGASGAIFGVIGALIVIKPLLVVWAFGLPMPIFVAGILWGAGDVIGAVGFLSGSPLNNTGNIAHLSGMFFGLIFGLFFRNLRNKWKVEGYKFRDKLKIKKRSVNISEKGFSEWENAYMKIII